MPGESISFDITASGDADRKFRQTGDAALYASGKIDIAAASVKAFDDATAKMGKASTTSTAAMKASTKALATVAEANRVVNSEFDKSIRYLKGQSNAFDDVAKKTEDAGKAAAGAASGFTGLAGLGGGGVTGMGALIAAGAVLSPILVTAGTGLAGLGLAAYGIAKPIENAAQKTGGLAKNLHLLNPEQQTVARGILALGKTFSGFERQLQPVVLGDFNKGLHLAGVLLHDIAPVSQAAGKALGGTLSAIDATFRGQEWQQFFSFMARTAGPDIKLLTDNFVGLLQVLPPLVENLQPVAKTILTDTSGLLKLVSATEGAVNTQHRYTQEITNSSGWLGKFGHAALAAFNEIVPGGHSVTVLTDKLSHLGSSSTTAGKALNTVSGGLFATSKAAYLTISPTDHLGKVADTTAGVTDVWSTAIKGVSGWLGQEAKALNVVAGAYEHALTPLENYINATLTQANDLHSLRQALQASGDKIGYNTQNQRNSFSAAEQYIQNTVQTGNAALATGKGIQGQIDTIRNALPVLENVKGKTADYRAELAKLKAILDALRQERTINEQVKVFGTGAWTVAGSGVVHGIGGHTAAAGWMVSGGSPNKDSVPIMAMPGELVVPKSMVSSGAVDHLRGSIPGFAAGGVVGSYGPGSITGLRAWTAADQQATVKALTNSIASSFASSFASAFGSVGGRSGPGGGSAAANAALAYRLYANQMTPAMWASWNYVAMRESGWNQFARNPSSGAYGIAQALPPTKYPFAGQAAGGSNPMAQITWMWNYMRASYGGPVGAAAHERAFNWYDKGGWLPPGPSLAFNGTGRPEMVVPNRGGGQQQIVLRVEGGSDQDLVAALVHALRKKIRTTTGGDVQKALGRS